MKRAAVHVKRAAVVFRATQHLHFVGAERLSRGHDADGGGRLSLWQDCISTGPRMATSSMKRAAALFLCPSLNGAERGHVSVVQMVAERLLSPSQDALSAGLQRSCIVQIP